MKLLVITQVVDNDHKVLGFFPSWLTELSKHFDDISVLCLQEGTHVLPEAVHVHSLGKQGDKSGWLDRLRYVVRLYAILYRLPQYDAVFVHMNEEYVLLAGWYWLLKGTPVYMWRNHYAGSMFTDIAAAFCTKVFCTSRYSYTAKYKKTVLMPVGTDARADKEDVVERKENSILSLGRIAASKRIHVIVEALGILKEQGLAFTATIRGRTEDEDAPYRDSLINRASELGLSSIVLFGDAVKKSDTHLQYRSHEYFINASPSGMLDKTIFSAATYGCIVFASSKDFAAEVPSDCVFEENDAESLAHTLKRVLNMTKPEKTRLQTALRAFANKHTLPHLAIRLREEMAAPL